MTFLSHSLHSYRCFVLRYTLPAKFCFICSLKFNDDQMFLVMCRLKLLSYLDRLSLIQVRMRLIVQHQVLIVVIVGDTRWTCGNR